MCAENWVKLLVDFNIQIFLPQRSHIIDKDNGATKFAPDKSSTTIFENVKIAVLDNSFELTNSRLVAVRYFPNIFCTEIH